MSPPPQLIQVVVRKGIGVEIWNSIPRIHHIQYIYVCRRRENIYIYIYMDWRRKQLAHPPSQWIALGQSEFLLVLATMWFPYHQEHMFSCPTSYAILKPGNLRHNPSHDLIQWSEMKELELLGKVSYSIIFQSAPGLRSLIMDTIH